MSSISRMEEFSILIGGKAGEGINQAGALIARILSRLGYCIHIYYDYPSLIRGGHNFSIIRASKKKIGAHQAKIDFLLALNQDAIDFHKNKLNDSSVVIYDADSAKSDGLAIPLGKIIKEEKAPSISRNSCIIGGLSNVLGIPWDTVEEVFKKNIPKELELNLKVARRGYDETKSTLKIHKLSRQGLPIFTGNEAIGLGLVNGGLDAYIAYPMTPASSILHFLAEKEKVFSLNVIHPENEISVILMALGFSYAGKKAAVGTSGGGFCLMTEGLSLAAMSETPVVIVVSQRPGPSTGVPTYTSQADLNFVLNAGHGEFLRFVVSPGDAEEAYYWSQAALNISWSFQIPSILLVDKALSEGTYSFDITSIEKMDEGTPLMWDKKGTYKRYLDTNGGVSPLAFAPDKQAIIKVNSYEHDEFGITTEEPDKIVNMQDKRLRKEADLVKALDKYNQVKIYGNKSSRIALICWGSTKGACAEIGKDMDLKVIQPVVLSPFPVKQFQNAIRGVKKLICIENNKTAQLRNLIKLYGTKIDKVILKYDGRPFSLDGLEKRLKEVV